MGAELLSIPYAKFYVYGCNVSPHVEIGGDISETIENRYKLIVTLED